MSWFKGKDGKVKITVELDSEVAEALGVLARKDIVGKGDERREKTVPEKAAEMLQEAVWNREERLLPNHAPPIVRMANRFLQHVLDTASPLRLTVIPQGVQVEYEVEGQWQPMTEGWMGDAPGLLPPYLHRPLFQRYEKVAGVRLQSREAKETARIPLSHNGEDYEITIGYEENPDAPSGESLVIRFD